MVKSATILNVVQRTALTSRYADHFFNRAASISSYSFIAADGLYAAKDALVSAGKNITNLHSIFTETAQNISFSRYSLDMLGWLQYWQYLSADTKAGLCFVFVSAAIRAGERAPRLAFRAAGMLSAIGIGYTISSGYDFSAAQVIDPGKVWTGLWLVPAAVLMGIQNELGKTGNWILRQERAVFNRIARGDFKYPLLLSAASAGIKAAGNIVRYPLIWSAGFNMWAMLGFLQSGVANFRHEWPLIGVAALGIYGNLGLIALDPRLRARSQYARFWKDMELKNAPFY